MYTCNFPLYTEKLLEFKPTKLYTFDQGFKTIITLPILTF